MANSSDSEEFYDAEELTPSHGSRKHRYTSKDVLTHRANSEPNVSNTPHTSEESGHFQSCKEFAVPEPPAKSTPLGGRKRFRELRQKLQNDDEDCQPLNAKATPPNSQTSSMDGVYAVSNKPSHPFRIIEQDALSLQSINSLGRLTRIVGTNDGDVNAAESSKRTPSTLALSSSSLDSGSTPSSKDTSLYPSNATLTLQTELITERQRQVIPLQEPDVIASAKAAKSGDGSEIKSPVAPPRRRKKALGLKKSTSNTTFVSDELASPASTIESLTREFEHSLDRLPSFKSAKLGGITTVESRSSTLRSDDLDIGQALKGGQFVVRPQDVDTTRVQSESGPVEAESSNGRASSMRSSVGHYSLGPHRGSHQPYVAASKQQRRRSAGDEDLLKNGSVRVRTHTDSGKQLSDLEILEQVTVLNLDTGERVPLSVAEDKLPQCINPLSLHIMRLTSEYVGGGSTVEKDEEEEDEEEEPGRRAQEVPALVDGEVSSRTKKRTAMLKRFVGTAVKKTMHKAKSIAQEVSHARHKEDVIDIVDVVHPGEQSIKLKASNSHKGPYEFEKVQHVQELSSEHEGPIWCTKFSCCGRLLATAGQDKVLRVWVVRDAFPFFRDMRTRYNAETTTVSPTPSQESLASSRGEPTEVVTADPSSETSSTGSTAAAAFMPRPFCTYTGHTSDLLDVSWSKNYFVLSSSMDKTVRLWHISRKECLCCFQHIDFVTAIVFHPRDDRYFLSGSLDGKLRLWNIPDKKVAVWNEVEGNPKLITAANFCQNGKFAVVGTYDGRCIFYYTDQLRYHTQIHVRSSRGRNAIGRKISGIEPMPGEDKILVTSNDSRIRLYDLRDLNVSCKYKGYVNVSSQIKASFSHDGKYIVSGSENRDVYIWRTHHDYAKFSSVRRDRNDFWEAIKAHNAVVTCAIFAPNPEAIIEMMVEEKDIQKEEETDPVVEQHTKGCGGYVLISADFSGGIKIFVNKTKPKHSSLPASAMVANPKAKKG